MPTLTAPEAAAPKHTRGPLHIARMDDGTVVIHDDSFLARHIAWLPSGVPDDEREANAALFRSAPELLEVSRLLLDELTETWASLGYTPREIEDHPSICRANAAIAKALGA